MRPIAAHLNRRNKPCQTALLVCFLAFLAPMTARGQYVLTWSAQTPGGRATGGSYALVTAVGSFATVDGSSMGHAPTPNPMQWETVPYATSSTSITMMAAEAQDPLGGVQYHFQNVTVSNHDSGWQDSRTYTDVGLAPDTSYQYRVKARGSIRMETAYSVQLPAKTEKAPEGSVPEGSAKPVSGELGNDLNLQVDPFTGSVSYTLPIAVPPGRQGSEPALALRYGGGGNGWCGFGWSLGMGAIQRDTRKGVPVARSGGTFLNKYDDSKGFVVAFGAVNSRLVLVNSPTHEYRAETDQAFLKYEYDGTYSAGNAHGLWTVTDKSGNKFYFGQMTGEGRTAGAIMTHPTFSSATVGDTAFLWALAKIQDINGNLTYVYYAQDANQVYLDEIRYNGHTTGPLQTTHSVQFEREDRDDKSISYATGYRVETNKRLRDIRIKALDLPGGQSQWVPVRRYHLTYARSPSTLRSLLQSVTVYGADDQTSLPPVTFEYQQKPFEFETDTAGYAMLRDWGPVDSGDWGSVGRTEWHQDGSAYNSDVVLLDINNDGLPDRVTRNTATTTYDPYAAPPANVFKVRLNTGTGLAAELADWGPVHGSGATVLPDTDIWNSSGGMRKEPWFEWIFPPLFRTYWASTALTSLMDLNGDGFLDRVLHRNTAMNASYDAASLLNYLYVQYGTGLGFERTGPNSGGGPDYVRHEWGPIDPQGFTGYTDLMAPYNYSKGYAWNSAQCSWDQGEYGITRVTMMDINGDGLPDRVTEAADGQSLWTYAFPPGQGKNIFHVQFNTGSGFERTNAGPGGGMDYITVDWGPVDALGATGSGVPDHAWNAPAASCRDGSVSGTFVAMMDINGDGLPDRVMRKASAPYDVFKVQFNTGYGFERTTSTQGGGTDFRTRDWGPLHNQGQSAWQWGCPQATTSGSAGGDNSYTGTFVDLFDINGDGLPDRVMQRAGAPYTVLKVELNTGTGFTHQIDGSDIEWSGVTTQGETYASWWGCVGLTKAYVTGDIDRSWEQVTMCDINGDGLPDRVMTDRIGGGDPVLKVQLNKGPFPDLLSKVTGALGGSAEVVYKPSTQYDNRDDEGRSRLGFPVQTVSSLTVDDGLGNRSTTTYDYARGYFDGQTREFRGFGKVTVTDPAGASSITFFHQGGGYDDPNAGEWQDAGSVAKKGMPYRVEIYDSEGWLHTITINKVEEAELVSGTGWHYAYVSQTTKLEWSFTPYDSGSNSYDWDYYRAKIRRSEYDIANKTGNILKSIDLGEVDLGITSEDIAANIAAHTYAYDMDTQDNLYIHTTYASIAGHPEIVNKIASTRTTSDYAGANKLKEIVFTYDTLGRVVTEKTWLDKTRDGPANRYTVTSQYGYDSYGNRSYSIDKAGIRTDTTYDNQYHMFPVTKTTGTFVTSTDYDFRSGLPVRTVDPAGMVTQNTYDSFFRLTDVMASTQPNGAPDLWVTHIDYQLGGITDEVSSNYVHQVHTGYEAYTYSDGLGRIVQTRTAATDVAPGTCRVVHTCYDKRGNVEFQTLPFFADGSEFSKPYFYNVYLKANAQPADGDLIGTTGSTHFELSGLAYATTYYWKVKKFGSSGNFLEQAGPWQFTTGGQAQAGWRDPENPPAVLSGLEYRCYNDSFPWWSRLPNFSTLYPCQSGTVGTFTTSVSSDHTTYGMQFTGYINITTGGLYTFYTYSCEGSRLYLGDTLVVDNDGLRLLGTQAEKSGAIYLKAGRHAIRVAYFNGIWSDALTVSYKGPDTSNAKIAIPSGVLSHKDVSAPPSANPYHQQTNVSVTPRLSWEGCLQDSQWDDAYAGVHTEYDAMGRVWKVTPAGDESGSPTGSSITLYGPGAGGDPWEEVFTDAEGKTTYKYFDAAGRVVELIEPGSIHTYYEYDLLGRLVKTTDHVGHEFRAEYDSLDRKIRSIDPDMGTWTYAYDDAGRMADQVAARGNKVEFTYNDELGRVTQKVVKNSGQQVREAVTYTYDQSDDPAYTVHKGQVYKVTDGQGWTKTGYDSQGRAIKSTRYLSANSKTYTTQTAYDAADRVTQITYPDTRAVVGYSYDDVGHLAQVESLWGTPGGNVVFYQASGFNEIDRATRIDYGNGRTTQYEYYERARRLKRMTTGGSSTIQDLSYTYDKVSNLKSVTDAVHAGTASCSLSNIQYDDLHRLVSVYSTSEGRTLTYEYTALGNINKNGEMGTGAYTYSATQPHAVTAANGSTYSYDVCGNMITRNRSGQPNQTLTYDEQNRLTQVAITGGSTIQFGYAAGGVRLWKKTSGQITGLWIGSLYEEKDGKILCHVYAGDRLVATFEPQSGFACIVENNPYLAAVWHFGDKTLATFFGGGRTPVTVMWAAALTGIALGLRYNRRRLLDRYGLQTYYGLRAFGGTDPWRQMVLLTLAAAVFLSSNPQAAYAGTPVYDPVFYYYHPDNLGSSQLMTDRDGDIVQQYGYSPYGRENYKNNTSAFSVSTRYTGQTLDEDTGLYYYGTRYYDPGLARFIQADSTVPDPGFSQAYNRYAYVVNNPLKFTDPTGQFWMIVAAAIIGAVVGGGSAALAGGDFGDILRGAFIGGLTGALSAGMGQAVGQMVAVSAQSAVIGSVAGAIAGFGASYATRGAMSGNWRFTVMDAVNLGIAIVFSLLDPRPGAERSAPAQHADSVDQSGGHVVGYVAPDDLPELLERAHFGVADPKDVGAYGVAPDPPFQWDMESVHAALDVAGMLEIPGTPIGIGFIFDGTNAALYAMEGRLAEAGLAGLSIVGGDLLIKTGKYGLQALKQLRNVPGVYAFIARSGKAYVGQSRFLNIRLRIHRWTGKLPAGNNVLVRQMPGSTALERRIVEQQWMNDLGGIRPNGPLDNVINSIRESDWPKYGIQPPKGL